MGGQLPGAGAQKLPETDPINEPTRATTVELVVNPEGEIVKLETTKSSGFGGFDDAVKDVLRDSVPFPRATVDLRSDDGLVHLSLGVRARPASLLGRDAGSLRGAAGDRHPQAGP